MVTVAPTMVGRAVEYQVLRTAADRALASLPQVVLLTGEAGIGKSRLVAELVRRCTPREWVVLVGSCSAAASRTLPLAPWIEAMSPLGIEPTRGLDPFATTGQQHGAMAGAVLEVARRRPTLVVIEDVHWADASSQELADFICRSMREERLLVVLTARTGGPAYDGVRELLGELAHLPCAARLPLSRLTEEAAREQAAQLAANKAPRQLDDIARLSEGVPFFVEQLVRFAPAGQPTADVAEGVVGHRLDRLSDDARAVVALAAIAFRDPPQEALEQALTLADRGDDVAAGLRAAVEHGILEPGRSPADGYRFHHALFREAMLGRLLPAERRALHRAWAQAWEQVVADPVLRAAAVAYHWLEARDDVRALTACLAAAAEAEGVAAHAERLELLTRAARLWRRVPQTGRPDDVELPDILLGAAEAAFSMGDVAGFRDLAAALRRQAGPSPTARLAWLRLMETLIDHQDNRTVDVSELADLLGSLRGHTTHRRMSLGCQHAAIRLLMAGRPTEARELSAEGVTEARTDGDPDLVAQAEGSAATIAASTGATADALRLARSVLTRLPACRDLAVVHETYTALTMVTWFLGDTPESLHWSRLGAAALGGDRPGPLRLAWAIQQLNLVEGLLETGAWDEAGEVLDRFRHQPSPTWAVDGWAERLSLHLGVLRGQAWARECDLSLGVELSSGQELPLGELQDILPNRFTFVDTFAYRGQLDEARAISDGVLWQPRLTACPAAYLYPFLLALAAAEADLARSGDDSAAAIAERIRSLLEAVPPTNDRDRAYAAHIRADLDRRLRGDTVAQWIWVVGRWRPARLPLRLGLALHHLGAAAARDGDRGTAATSLAEAAEIAEGLGARPLLEAVTATRRSAHLPDRARVSPWGLTSRELEVLELMSEGETNAGISKRLFISPKTVSVHVSHVLAKTGAVNRTQAADLARRAGIALPST